MLQQVKFESECVWRKDYLNEGVSSDWYVREEGCLYSQFPALDHNHFDSACDVHGALCGVEVENGVEKSDTGRACLGRMSIADVEIE